MAIASSPRPKSSGNSAALEEDYQKALLEWEGKSGMRNGCASDNAEQTKDDENTDTSSSSSSHMDDWFKTLEEFDMGSGSEMLRQIGMSLRERSNASQEHQHQSRASRADAANSTGSESEVKTLGLKQRSKSASRFNQAPSSSTSLDAINPPTKPPISKKPDLKSFLVKRDSFQNKTPGASATDSSSLTTTMSTFKSEITNTDYALSKPAIPPRSVRTLPAARSQSMSHGFSGPPPPLPAKPKLPALSSKVAEHRTSTGSQSGKEKIQTIFTPSPLQLQQIVLEKKSPLDDFGFSLSDAVDDKGVYVSSVRSGSLADAAGLKSYDRLLQVNKTKTKESDCATVVPLIAQTGKRLSLVVCRNPLLPKESEAKGHRSQRAAQSVERESVAGKARYTLPLGLSAIVARSSKARAFSKEKETAGKKS
ncbi:glutamate receptor-interacting protein 2 [Plakobranchus ocellatus]|uniref:Glutamate receptor-interacting protein 2 n=1 Tax=Plakobranchus ocellatus TaxID=259542 RepID=A0AAV3YNS2_9GAST|nr:glutamate receptor-interacting protein 2 [Plakobranchus ocellatus]